MFFDEHQIEKLEKIYRVNLMNSCSGYKSANLIGTISNNGQYNLSVFSSIVSFHQTLRLKRDKW